MVAAHGDAALQTAEDWVVGHDVAGGGHTMKNVAEVFQPCAKHLADGLMAQTNAEDGLSSGKGSDDIAQ